MKRKEINRFCKLYGIRNRWFHTNKELSRKITAQQRVAPKIYATFNAMMRECAPSIEWVSKQWNEERGRLEKCKCWNQCYDVHVKKEDIKFVQKLIESRLMIQSAAFIKLVTP